MGSVDVAAGRRLAKYRRKQEWLAREIGRLERAAEGTAEQRRLQTVQRRRLVVGIAVGVLFGIVLLVCSFYGPGVAVMVVSIGTLLVWRHRCDPRLQVRRLEALRLDHERLTRWLRQQEATPFVPDRPPDAGQFGPDESDT